MTGENVEIIFTSESEPTKGINPKVDHPAVTELLTLAQNNRELDVKTRRDLIQKISQALQNHERRDFEILSQLVDDMQNGELEGKSGIAITGERSETIPRDGNPFHTSTTN